MKIKFADMGRLESSFPEIFYTSCALDEGCELKLTKSVATGVYRIRLDGDTIYECRALSEAVSEYNKTLESRNKAYRSNK